MRVILASASPRRRELLTQIIPDFEVIPAAGEETFSGDTPEEIVVELAKGKAASVADDKTDPGEDALVIGADTIVVRDGQILGKPRDEADAYRMLRALSGDVHQVFTGVCLIRSGPDGRDCRAFYEETEVYFYPMSEEEIRAYIGTGDPMDKAGAYGIQSGCGKYIRGIRGDYNNVVGLPLARLYRELKSFF